MNPEDKLRSLAARLRDEPEPEFAQEPTTLSHVPKETLPPTKAAVAGFLAIPPAWRGPVVIVVAILLAATVAFLGFVGALPGL